MTYGNLRNDKITFCEVKMAQSLPILLFLQENNTSNP